MKKVEWVTIVWEDACSEHGWYDPEENDQTEAITITSGILVHESERLMTISATLNEFGFFADPITIPKSCIIHRKKIKIPLPDVANRIYATQLEGEKMPKKMNKADAIKKAAAKPAKAVAKKMAKAMPKKKAK